MRFAAPRTTRTCRPDCRARHALLSRIFIMVTELSGRACAKINLFLRVTGRRVDGYHELDSVFLPLSLADEIRLEIRAADEPSVSVNCNLPELARSKDNLAARAARSFMSEFDLVADVLDRSRKTYPGWRRTRRRLERRRHGFVHDGGSGTAHRRRGGRQVASNRAVARCRCAVFSRSAALASDGDRRANRDYRGRSADAHRYRSAAVRGFDRCDFSRARARGMERRGARRAHRGGSCAARSRPSF